MNNQGTLLDCPICRITPNKDGDIHPQFLGRLLPNGEVMILRFGSKFTIIQSPSITLSCSCGFSYYIQGTHIEGTAMLTI